MEFVCLFIYGNKYFVQFVQEILKSIKEWKCLNGLNLKQELLDLEPNTKLFTFFYVELEE